MQFISNNIGVYFSLIEIVDTDCLPVSCTLAYIPQFENPQTNNLGRRNGWTEISGIYLAMGGEKYFVIGNFRDSASTLVTSTGWSNNHPYAYYFIDDVLITPCDSLSFIDDLKFINEMKLSPNPSSGFYTIHSPKNIIQDIKIEDILGRLVFELNFIDKKDFNLDISDKATGIYFLQIKTDSSFSQFKLVKN